MKVESLAIAELLLCTPALHRDGRGLFVEAWNDAEYGAAGIRGPWVQDNLSESVQGALRGLHCQVRQTQGKLVRCVAGAVFDVAVDVRARSATFGQWCGARLDDEVHAAMFVPPGFAHGYLVLSERATLHYKVTDYYAPRHERSLRWDDPDVAIAWPLAPGASPVLSARDATAASLAEARAWFP